MKEQEKTYRLNLTEIKQIVSECVKRVVSESISQVSYHFASLKSCVSILDKNEFHLTLSSNRSDAFDNKRLFYLATQRSRNKRIAYASHFGTCARIQIDGNAISQRYKGKPVDYWQYKQKYYNPEYEVFGTGFTTWKQEHHDFEMEDRIFSYKPVIKDADKYITRIDIYIDRSRKNWLEMDMDMALTIYMLCKRLKINVFVYDDLNAFNAMSKNNINAEFEEEMNKYSEPYFSKSYGDSERGKALGMKNKTDKYVEILYHLFNVLTMGNLRKNFNETFSIVSNVLKKFGLEHYKDDLVKRMMRGYGTQFIESCELLSSTANVPIRKLNTDEYQDDTDASKIMEVGAYVLRKLGASNFDDLKR